MSGMIGRKNNDQRRHRQCDADVRFRRLRQDTATAHECFLGWIEKSWWITSDNMVLGEMDEFIMSNGNLMFFSCHILEKGTHLTVFRRQRERMHDSVRSLRRINYQLLVRWKFWKKGRVGNRMLLISVECSKTAWSRWVKERIWIHRERKIPEVFSRYFFSVSARRSN